MPQRQSIDTVLMKELRARDFSTFGDLSMYVRNKWGMNRSAFGKLIGDEHGGYVHAIETGRVPPSPKIFHAYSQLGLPKKYLLDLYGQEMVERMRKRLAKI